MTKIRALLLLLSSLVLFRFTEGLSSCPILEPLLFGQLLLDGNDVSFQQPESIPDQIIEYKCAIGYDLVDATTNSILSQTTTVCIVSGMNSGNWSLLGVACRARLCNTPPAIANGMVDLNGSNVFFLGSIVYYQCESGYRIEQAGGTANTLGVVSAVCNNRGQWELIPTCVADSSPLVSDYNRLLIILIFVAAISCVLMCFTLGCSLWAFKLRREITKGDMAEDEVAYAHSQGAFTLSNPLVVTKDDESVGNPLYLTPEEMDEFESKRKQTNKIAD